MNQLDVYYRGLLEYRRLTTSNRECNALRSAIKTANTENDKIEITRILCTVDEEWVKTIEEGLRHVEAAIREERQFIRSNGDVVPIEKVRHVSKESIEHLAKHGNLMGKYEEGEDIIPEQLYTVERLSDFAVYENRFLYMLLCYLRDFVMLRYDNILDLTTRYEGRLEMQKTVVNGLQKFSYTVTMDDVRSQDWYLKENNPLKDILKRIDSLLKTIVILLETPLMQEVSKVAMIKPPITKTNVLKMNKNFKGAMALYDYIISYTKPGYESETQVTAIAPFREDLAEELAETGILTAFLTYEYGLGIKNDLKAEYNKEEDRRKLEKITQRAERIKGLQRRLRAAEIPIEEYTLTLEKQLRELEDTVARAERLQAEVERLTELTEEQIRAIDRLNAQIERLNEEMEEMKRAHAAQIAALHAEYQAQIAALHEEYQAQIAALHEEYQAQIAALHEEYRAQISALHEEYQAQITALHEEYQGQLKSLKTEYEDRISALHTDYRTQLAAQEKQYTEQLELARQELQTTKETLGRELNERDRALGELTEAHAAQVETNKILEARIKALGGVELSAMDREGFNQLEDEYKAFQRYYTSVWKETKKKIRKDHISMEKIKGQKGQNESSD